MPLQYRRVREREVVLISFLKWVGTANAIGWRAGSFVILDSAGHVRVTVNEAKAQVDYVSNIVSGMTRSDLENGAVEHS